MSVLNGMALFKVLPQFDDFQTLNHPFTISECKGVEAWGQVFNPDPEG